MRSILVLFFLSGGVGCGVDDKDRCLDGYTFDAQIGACQPEEPPLPPVPCGEGDYVPEGFAASCQTQDDCAVYEDASLCQDKNPLAPAYCTYECETLGCPSCYQCCNCSTTENPVPTVCLSDGDAELAKQFRGCSCTGE